MASAGRQDLQLQGHVGRHFPGWLYRMFQESWRVLGTSKVAQPPGEPERKPERCFSRGQDSQASGTIPQVLPLSTPAQPDPTSLPQGQEAAWRELAADLLD